METASGSSDALLGLVSQQRTTTATSQCPQMKEKPVPTKHAKPTRGEATTEDGRRQDVKRRSETGRRVRKIVARHRETFDELAK